MLEIYEPDSFESNAFEANTFESSNTNGLSETTLIMVMTPNRSFSWEQNKKVLWALGLWSASIALAFTLRVGAWPILPFAGLEILLLVCAFYYVSWKSNQQQVITFQKTNLRVEKGVYRPRQSWQLPKQETYLNVTLPNHQWEAKNLTLIYAAKHIPIGEFLSKSDINKAVDIFSQYIQVRNNE